MPPVVAQRADLRPDGARPEQVAEPAEVAERAAVERAAQRADRAEIAAPAIPRPPVQHARRLEQYQAAQAVAHEVPLDAARLLAGRPQQRLGAVGHAGRQRRVEGGGVVGRGTPPAAPLVLAAGGRLVEVAGEVAALGEEETRESLEHPPRVSAATADPRRENDLLPRHSYSAISVRPPAGRRAPQFLPARLSPTGSRGAWTDARPLLLRSLPVARVDVLLDGRQRPAYLADLGQ